VSDEIEPIGGERAPLPFEDLAAPEPIEADPPPSARIAAFGSVLLGGLLGGLVGYGVGDVMFRDDLWAAVGALLGALTGAIGVGVVANLTLRAMNEWNAVNHPEDDRTAKRRKDRQWSRRTP
jgi:outer membrane lipoprotein SlyB